MQQIHSGSSVWVQFSAYALSGTFIEEAAGQDQSETCVDDAETGLLTCQFYSECIEGENCVIEVDPSEPHEANDQGDSDNCSVVGLQGMLCCFWGEFDS